MDRKRREALSEIVNIDEDDLKGWVKKYYEPSEIFSHDDLEEWAKYNIKQIVTDNFCPGDIFDDGDLKDWARDNGFEETK